MNVVTVSVGCYYETKSFVVFCLAFPRLKPKTVTGVVCNVDVIITTMVRYVYNTGVT